MLVTILNDCVTSTKGKDRGGRGRGRGICTAKGGSRKGKLTFKREKNKNGVVGGGGGGGSLLPLPSSHGSIITSMMRSCGARRVLA